MYLRSTCREAGLCATNAPEKQSTDKTVDVRATLGKHPAEKPVSEKITCRSAPVKTVVNYVNIALPMLCLVAYKL